MKCEFCPAYFFDTVALRNHAVTAHPTMVSDEWKQQVLGRDWQARFPELDQDADTEANSRRVEKSTRRQSTLSALARASVVEGTQEVL